jgi:hypothetical protein
MIWLFWLFIMFCIFLIMIFVTGLGFVAVKLADSKNSGCYDFNVRCLGYYLAAGIVAGAPCFILGISVIIGLIMGIYSLCECIIINCREAARRSEMETREQARAEDLGNAQEMQILDVKVVV